MASSIKWTQTAISTDCKVECTQLEARQRDGSFIAAASKSPANVALIRSRNDEELGYSNCRLGDVRNARVMCNCFVSVYIVHQTTLKRLKTRR